MARLVTHDEKPFALFIEPDASGAGGYLVPPIVRLPDGEIALGREILEAVVKTGISVPVPAFEVDSVADVAAIEQVLANMAAALGTTLDVTGDSDAIARGLLETLDES